jgi:hypothetical protein
MVAGQAKPSSIHNDPRQFRECIRRDNPPPMMSSFWPGIGEQDKTAFNRAVWKRFNKLASIRCVNSDIFDVRNLYGSDQAGYAVNKGFATDEPNFGMRLRLRRKMLAAAKPNFKPNGLD